MNNMNILAYLLICPFNLIYIFDLPSYIPDINKKLENDEVFIYGKEIRKNESAYSLHYEKYLYELSRRYYYIILKYNKELGVNQEKEYNLIMSTAIDEKKKKKNTTQGKYNNNDKWKLYQIYGKEEHKSYELIRVEIYKKDILLIYKNEKTKSSIKFIINKRKDIKNYLSLCYNNCINKLDKNDYNILKTTINNSKENIINSSYIYMYIIFFFLCIYVEKNLFLYFPILLQKYEIITTLLILFIPLILFVFFYFYFTIIKLISSCLVLYITFQLIYYIKGIPINMEYTILKYTEKEEMHDKKKDITYTVQKDIENNLLYNSNKGDTSIYSCSNEREEYIIHNTLKNFRLMNICMTYICIFAVDFYFFPNHFCKSYYYGNTLMDIGIGASISSSAYSQEIRKFTYIKEKKRIIGLKHIVLFILGISRFIAIYFFNYNYNVSEYGIHWNFFLTLCSTFLICNIFFILLKRISYIFLFSLFSITLFEIAIYYFDLHNYILLKNDRLNFFSSNKEGLFNIIGSVNLYLFSFSLFKYLTKQTTYTTIYNITNNKQDMNNSMYCKQRNHNDININNTINKNVIRNNHINEYTQDKTNKFINKQINNNSNKLGEEEKLKKKKNFKKKIVYYLLYIQYMINIYKEQYYTIYYNIKLFISSFIFYLLHIILNLYKNYSVRILCNANYIFLITSLGLFSCALSFSLEDILLRYKKKKINIDITILDKMNKNTLIVFLFSNILVGMFNILFQSLLLPLIFVIPILVFYSLLILLFTKCLPYIRHPKKTYHEKKQKKE
ncbi:GPI-anchored wall transfer protein 1, putative [Plasmodium sp. DRC-Itaito]|nr:GPI-anchored wall transfer protein 1, putative [Plasmodium sp. DRC-Itaito]